MPQDLPEKPAQVGQPPIAPGTRQPVRGRELPMPHERDESTDAPVEHRRDVVIEQARRDLAAGQVDTDLRTTPGLDAERREAMTKPGGS